MIDYPLQEIVLPMGGNTVKDEVKMEALWDDPKYIAEEKYDGSRYLSVGGRFFSRKLSVKTKFPVEKTENVPHLAFLRRYPLLILDGEVYRNGMTSNEVTKIMGASGKKASMRQGFGDLKHSDDRKKLFWRLHEDEEWVEVKNKEMDDILSTQEPLDYIVFDILRDAEGNWLMDKPWKERRAILESVYHSIQADNETSTFEGFIPNFQISQVEDRPSKKRDFYKEIMARNGEGVMLKNVDGLYAPDKKPAWNWVKVKKHITADVIITGFKPAKRDYVGDEIGTHPYWITQNGSKITRGRGDTGESLLKGNFIPVTKFFYYDWIGAVTFSKYDARYKLINIESDHLYTKEEIVSIIRQDYEAEGTTPEEKGFDIDTHIEDFYDKVMVLVEVGYCSGINEELRQDMSENPSKYIGQVMEIGAMEVTNDGFYRHPQFSRFRDDKNAEDCIVGID